jgi:peptidoglycan/xylan/chitin deacetylase (PgdA/CDA1 family)
MTGDINMTFRVLSLSPPGLAGLSRGTAIDRCAHRRLNQVARQAERGRDNMANDLAVCLTFDVDGMCSWITTMKSNNPSALSRGEFTTVATPRVLRLLKKYDIQATFFVPGHTACAFPDMIRQIHDAGHEIGHHSWAHENPATLEEADERRILERALRALERGAGVRGPLGYRSPAWDFSKNTVKLLIELGFLYDSSCMGDDFNPYYLRTDDQWSADDPYLFGPLTSLVELPVTWGLDDFPPFETLVGVNPGQSAPSAVEEIWYGDFEYALNSCSGGVYTLTMHPEFIGRGHRILMLERLINRFTAHSGVRFCTLRDYAARWKANNPLEAWTRANKFRAGTGAITALD